MIVKKTNLHFECNQCGACCYGNEDYYIAVNAPDMEKICEHLGIGMAWLKRRYVERLDRQLYSIRIAGNGRCVFLGEDKRCRIYPVRPVQCRTYPWWPELLESKNSWNAEARRCEGINVGKQVAVSHIIAALNQQQAFDKDTE